MVLLIVKSLKCMVLVFLKYLELLDIKMDLEELYVFFFVEVFCFIFLEGWMYWMWFVVLVVF